MNRGQLGRAGPACNLIGYDKTPTFPQVLDLANKLISDEILVVVVGKSRDDRAT